MEKCENIVLGAGISGLAYANAIGKKDSLIIEKNDYYGGLCHSFKIGNFVFDTAVHLSFTNNEFVKDVFNRVDVWKHKPIPYNFYSGKWIKHPIINNLCELEPEDKVSFIKSYINRDEKRAINSYRDWLLASYGEEFTSKLYEVYTKKYWTMNADSLTTEWIGNRLASTSIEKILKGSFYTDDEVDYYAKEMRYPKNGGFQHFIDQLAESCNILYNNKVIELDLENNLIVTDCGDSYRYSNLASSIPLNELVKITRNIPSRLVELSERLKCTKISIVSVGFSKPDVAKWLWFYIYDKSVMAARVNSPSLKSINNTPEGCSSLQFEIYHNDDDFIDEKSIVDNVKESIKKLELCDESDILFMDYRFIEYGNVIFTKNMTTARNEIRHYYETNGIDLIGRFGEFEYYWSDQAFMSGWNKGNERMEVK